jgi:hypothetical protein
VVIRLDFWSLLLSVLEFVLRLVLLPSRAGNLIDHEMLNDGIDPEKTKYNGGSVNVSASDRQKSAESV